MVNSCAVCGCCTRTDIVREHLEDTLRIYDVSAKGLYACEVATVLVHVLCMCIATVTRRCFHLSHMREEYCAFQGSHKT